MTQVRAEEPEVPASLTFEEQVAIASGQARDADGLYEQHSSSTAGGIGSTAIARRPPICGLYAQQILDLDEETRQPLLAWRQDRIRLDRMSLISAMARERC